MSGMPQGFFNAADAPSSDLLKILLYGQSGTGKTTCACTAPDPVVALTELKSARRIKAMAKQLGVNVMIAPIETVADMDNFIAQMRNAPKTMTCVIDSASDYYRIIIDRITSKRADPLPSKTDWGTIQSTMERMLRDVVSLPHNVIVLSGQKEYITKEMGEEVRRVVPAFSGDTMPMYIGKLFQAVGLTFKRMDQANGNVYHLVQFAGEDRILSKLDDGLRNIEVPNVQLWMEAIGIAYKEGRHNYSFDYNPVTTNPEIMAPATIAEVSHVVKKQ